MMVALVLYSYCLGERSARRIERRLHEDVAYRVIAANQAPDHATIARFRQEHEEALAGLFSECLRLCVAAGLGKVGVVAIDGTKMAAAASLSANRTNDAIEAEVRRIMAEAKATDEAEDALYGEGVRGDELPPELADRTSRLARLKEAKRRLDEEDAARGAGARRAPRRARADRARAREEAAGPKAHATRARPPGQGQHHRSREPHPEDPPGLPAGLQRAGRGQHRPDHPGRELTQQENDVGQLHPMIAATEKALHDAGASQAIGAVVADAGYMSDQNLADADAAGPELLIAATTAHTQRIAQKEKGAPRGRIPKAATPRQRMARKLLTKRGQGLYACARRPWSRSSARSRTRAASAASCDGGSVPAGASGSSSAPPTTS